MLLGPPALAAQQGTATTPQSAAAAFGGVLLIPNGIVPLQGNCSHLPTQSHSGPTAMNSTWSCPGLSNSPLNFLYTNGHSEGCLYIDNSSNPEKTFFVPMRTLEEWLDFKAATEGGSLHPDVALTHGCAAATKADSCGNNANLPVARNGATITVQASPGMSTTFTCVAGGPGCGLWQKTTEDGHCPENGLCGAAANQSWPPSGPSGELCSAGTASAITGSGPWYWTCLGLYGGTDASCSAQAACVPNDHVVGVDPCSSSATCGGTGTQTVHWDDGCGNNRTTTQSCALPACSCTPGPRVILNHGACSVTCGGGTQLIGVGDGCTTWIESQPCNTHACACVPGPVVVLNEGACSVTCGGGTQAIGVGDGCTTWVDSRPCNTHACACVPGPTVILNEGACSATCGGGTQAIGLGNGCTTWVGSQPCNTHACACVPGPLVQTGEVTGPSDGGNGCYICTVPVMSDGCTTSHGAEYCWWNTLCDNGGSMPGDGSGSGDGSGDGGGGDGGGGDGGGGDGGGGE